MTSTQNFLNRKNNNNIASTSSHSRTNSTWPALLPYTTIKLENTYKTTLVFRCCTRDSLGLWSMKRKRCGKLHEFQSFLPSSILQTSLQEEGVQAEGRGFKEMRMWRDKSLGEVEVDGICRAYSQKSSSFTKKELQKVQNGLRLWQILS